MFRKTALIVALALSVAGANLWAGENMPPMDGGMPGMGGQPAAAPSAEQAREAAEDAAAKALAEKRAQLADKMNQTKITVSFENVALPEALKQISDLSKVKATFDVADEAMKVTVTLKGELGAFEAFDGVASLAGLLAEPTEAGVTVRRPVGSELLDKKVTINSDALTLGDLVKRLRGDNINIIVNNDVTTDDNTFTVNVVNIPLREVIAMVANAAGVQCNITRSGVVVLYTQGGRNNFMRMMRMGPPGGGDAQGGNNRRRGGNNQGGQQDNNNNKKEEGVF